MSILNSYKKNYKMYCKCLNCKKVSEQKIPMRITIRTFLKNNMGLCPNCGNSHFIEATTAEVNAERERRNGENKLEW